MKTAMQELIDEIDSAIKGNIEYGDKDAEYNKGAISNLSSMKVIANRLLKKEMEQIVSAWQDGDDNGLGNNAYLYFSKIFKTI